MWGDTACLQGFAKYDDSATSVISTLTEVNTAETLYEFFFKQIIIIRTSKFPSSVPVMPFAKLT